MFSRTPEDRPYGGVAGRVGEALENLTGGRAPLPVDDVHDLPLAPAQPQDVLVFHVVLILLLKIQHMLKI